MTKNYNWLLNESPCQYCVAGIDVGHDHPECAARMPLFRFLMRLYSRLGGGEARLVLFSPGWNWGIHPASWGDREEFDAEFQSLAYKDRSKFSNSAALVLFDDGFLFFEDADEAKAEYQKRIGGQPCTG